MKYIYEYNNYEQELVNKAIKLNRLPFEKVVSIIDRLFKEKGITDFTISEVSDILLYKFPYYNLALCIGDATNHNFIPYNTFTRFGQMDEKNTSKIENLNDLFKVIEIIKNFQDLKKK